MDTSAVVFHGCRAADLQPANKTFWILQKTPFCALKASQTINNNWPNVQNENERMEGGGKGDWVDIQETITFV